MLKNLTLGGLILGLSAILISCSSFLAVRPKRHKHLPPSTIVLTKHNTVILDEGIGPSSMYLVTLKTIYLNYNLAKGEPIYLVLDTPGGHIDEFLKYIQLAETLNREIKTVTVLAASAGAFMVQGLGERLTTLNGVMMFHEMSVDYPQAVFRHQLVKWVAEDVKYAQVFEEMVAKRLNLSLEAYQKRIEGRDWFIRGGYNMLDHNAADRVVLLRCDETIKAKLADCFDLP
jgi:ATP-dependent protease ClpP protease subunit